MEEFNELIESEHRFCPICDEEIFAGSSVHKCSKKKLKEFEKKSRYLENSADEYEEEERTYDDKLRECEEHFDNENYYDIDNN